MSWRYPGSTRPALDHVSLELARGSILGLLGPNGAGKSTLVAHLAGLLPLTTGAIRINDIPLAQSRRLDPTRIAIAPQELAFYPQLTVDENLACFAAASRLGSRRAREAGARCAAIVGLQAHGRTRAAKLSGGFRRRLNLAIALLAEPDLLVLDEPTVGVDTESRMLLIETIRSLARAGAAVVYASHYLEEVEALADSVAVLHQGRVLRTGTLETLLTGEPERLVVALASPAPQDLIDRLGSFGVVSREGSRLTIELAHESSPIAALSAIERYGSAIRNARFGRSRLEEVLAQLTRDPTCSQH
ncbi:MAG: ABC transporter ATP-binding protein [Burkholderiaceae bacterium]